MEQYDHVILGFGKAGKTLAATLAAGGERVALVERDSGRYGGTCINVGCIPSKSLETNARRSAALGGDFADKAARYRKAVEEKRRLTGMLRQKNYDKVVSAGVRVLDGSAAFVDDHCVAVTAADGSVEEIRGEKLYINTGSVPVIPPVPGLAESARVYTSETLMELEELPERLAILGGGYIGVEFASYYANFGSQVTILQDAMEFIPREDEEVAAAVLKSLEARGAQLLRGVKLSRVQDTDGGVRLWMTTPDGELEMTVSALLVATGRRPETAGLNLPAAGVRLTERGAVQVDEHLRTSVPHIWAMGDVAGGLQFTYISLDDFRIVKSQLKGDGSRTTANRGAVPYSVFLDPPLARVGMTEAQARAQGLEVAVARLPAAAVPKAQVLGKTTGLLKMVVERGSGRILGAHLFCAESHEMINLVKLAMDAGLPYTVLRDAIYTHPTMSEAFNDLLGTVK